MTAATELEDHPVLLGILISCCVTDWHSCFQIAIHLLCFLAGIHRSPSPELPLPAAPSPTAPSVPDSRTGVQRSDAAEKEHHERMRRVSAPLPLRFS